MELDTLSRAAGSRPLATSQPATNVGVSSTCRDCEGHTEDKHTYEEQYGHLTNSLDHNITSVN